MNNIDLYKHIPAFDISPQNIGASNSDIITTRATSIYMFNVYNKSSSIRYFQLFNTTSLPSDGNTPTYSFVIGPNSVLLLDSNHFGSKGLFFSVGLTWAFSSTEDVLTLASQSDITSYIGYL